MPGFFILTLMSIMEMELKKPFISLTGSCFATKRLFTVISIAIFFLLLLVSMTRGLCWVSTLAHPNLLRTEGLFFSNLVSMVSFCCCSLVCLAVVLIIEYLQGASNFLTFSR
jgi:hypothetical protein